jgi:hypothetical protein
LYLRGTEVILPIVVIAVGKDDDYAGFPVGAVSDYQP